METKFEISFQDTEEMYCRLFNRLYFKRYVAYAAGFALFTAWLVYLWIRSQWLMYGGMALIFAIGIVWYLQYPRSMGKKNYKSRLEHLRGQEPRIQMSFGADIHVDEEGSGSTLSYDKIAHVYLLKDMLILVMSYQSAFFAPYDGLTKGTKEELIAFLETRCTEAKFHR